MKKVRRFHTPEFKAEVAIAAIQAGGATQQLSRDFGVHRNLVQRWRDELVARAEMVFLERVAELIAEPAAPRDGARD